MSLTFALGMTARGLQATENRMTISSQNITNADKPGYTRKTITDQYVTSNAGTVPIFGSVQGSIDLFLSQTVIRDVSQVGYHEVIADYLDLYGKQMGSTDGATTLSGYMNSMYNTLQILATNPETSANKAEFVSIAQNLANSLRNVSRDIQTQRLQADKEIEETVSQINNSLNTLYELNEAVVSQPRNDAGLAEYQDQRLFELEKLSQFMDIQYFFDVNNRVQIYSSTGQALLLSTPHPITYTASTAINSGTVYPAGFAPILLNGVDITTLTDNGKLGGLIELRDGVLVEEQAKLDEFANTLQDELNTLLNSGASLPARTTMTGSTQGLTPATAFAATGSIRVAVIDNQGVVNNFTDIPLGAMATINDLVVALNGVANVNASLGVNGELIVSSTLANFGLAFNQLNSNVTAASQTVSDFFGLNDLFNGTGAETIDVASYLQADNDLLAIGFLSASATLAIGDRGVPRGDGSLAEAMSDLMVTNVSFGAAGNFAAQSNTLKNYAESIIANAASRANVAQQEADTYRLVYQQTKDVLNNQTGVNIDEETARMVELQTKYEASARVIATIRDMFAALMDAVR